MKPAAKTGLAAMLLALLLSIVFTARISEDSTLVLLVLLVFIGGFGLFVLGDSKL